MSSGDSSGQDNGRFLPEGYIDRPCVFSRKADDKLFRVLRGKANETQLSALYFCVRAVRGDYESCPRGSESCIYRDGEMHRVNLTDEQKKSLHRENFD